jgi:hypothetical protein
MELDVIMQRTKEKKYIISYSLFVLVYLIQTPTIQNKNRKWS